MSVVTAGDEQWMDHPAIRSIAERMSKLDQMVEEFIAKAEPARLAAVAATQDFQETQIEFGRILEEKGRSVRDLRREADEITRAAKEARWEKDQLSRELRDALAAMREQQMRLEADEKWGRYLDENEWVWAKGDAQGRKIRPFQWDGSRFMSAAKDEGLAGRANCDQMGLGKTLQATATLDMLAQDHTIFCEECKPWHQSVLWLCPASIKDTSTAEIEHWSPERPVGQIQGNPGMRDAMAKLAWANGMTLVVNYETLRNTPAVLWEQFQVGKSGIVVGLNGEAPIPRHWPIIVLDEAHAFKNSDTQLFAFIEQLCENAGLVFPMTGTPIQNRPQEFWALLHMLTLKGKYAGKFDDKQRFINEYCSTYGGEVSFRPYAADELMKSVKNLVIRRRKDEVLKDLPPKTGGVTRWAENPDELVRYVELSGEQRALYENMRDRFFVWLDDQQKEAIAAPIMIAQFTRLRQIALYPKGVKLPGDPEAGTVDQYLECEQSAKFDEAMVLMDELGVAEGEQLLIFTSYEDEVVNALKARINEAYPNIEVGRITGKENSAKKAQVQARFNDPNDNMRVVIGTTRAMGIGLNLQASCSNCLFLDPDWNPGVMEQAEDRLHRQGQASSVNVHTIRARGTIDGYMTMKLMRKIDMTNGVIERAELRQARDDGLI
jgi:SNF2 family DNA or RNA helicase